MAKIVTRRADCPPFITKDGSTVRELMAYRNSDCRNSSLAEATLPVGAHTDCHRHREVEEVYYFLEGRGRILAGTSILTSGPACPYCISRGRGIRPGIRAMFRWCSSACAPLLMSMTTPTYCPTRRKGRRQ